MIPISVLLVLREDEGEYKCFLKRILTYCPRVHRNPSTAHLDQLKCPASPSRALPLLGMSKVYALIKVCRKKNEQTYPSFWSTLTIPYYFRSLYTLYVFPCQIQSLKQYSPVSPTSYSDMPYSVPELTMKELRNGVCGEATLKGRVEGKRTRWRPHEGHDSQASCCARDELEQALLSVRRFSLPPTCVLQCTLYGAVSTHGVAN